MNNTTQKFPHSAPLVPPLEGNRKTALLSEKANKNSPVPRVPPFSLEKNIREKYKRIARGKERKNIYRNNNWKKGGTGEPLIDSLPEIVQKYPQLEHPEICELIRYLRELHGLPKSTEGIRKLEIKYRYNGDDLWACINRIIFGDNRPVEQVNRYCPEYILTHKGQRPAVRCNECRRARCKTEVRP